MVVTVVVVVVVLVVVGDPKGSSMSEIGSKNRLRGVCGKGDTSSGVTAILKGFPFRS